MANIGLRPRPDQLVLDVDLRHNGHIELTKLEITNRRLPATRKALTGGGGWHWWFTYDGGPLRGKLAQGIDVKGHGGYLVAPPSVHVSGHRYEWRRIGPVVDAPAWLVDLVTPPRPTRLWSLRGGHRRADAALVRLVAGAPEGNRNNRLFWAACCAHERGGSPQLLAELVAAAQAAGLPEIEVRRTLASAARTVGGGR